MGNLNEEPGQDPDGGSAADGSEDRFWGELCEALERAGGVSAQELADAEQLLAGIDASEVAPLDPLRIEQLRRSAEAMGSESTVSPQVASLHAGPVHSGRFGRWFAAAAAVFVAPKFLAAAALVTVAVTTNYFLRQTTKSLPFQEAIAILVNEGADATSRGAAQGRVAFDVAESLASVRALDGEGPELRQHAEVVRSRLRGLLGGEPAFIVRRFDASLEALLEVVVDQRAILSDRHAALDAVAAQLGYGVAALRWVRASLSPELLEQNGVWTNRLQRLLE